MSEVPEYRRYAQMCVENAETAPSEGDRKAFLSLARHWLKTASEAEGRQILMAPEQTPVSTTRRGTREQPSLSASQENDRHARGVQ